MKKSSSLMRSWLESPFLYWTGKASVVLGVIATGSSLLLLSGSTTADTKFNLIFADRFSQSTASTSSGLLNDTGIEWCADNNTNHLTCPVASHAGQDGDHGRDALARQGQLTKVGDGDAGFDFTKLDSNGNDLLASANTWSCVRDNHTGLIWEVKLDDPAHLRHRNHTYSWYNPNPTTNGGFAGCQAAGQCNGSICDTHGFVQAVNVEGLCGADDWRIPSRMELQSLAHLGRESPSIDTDFFPQASSNPTWSSSPFARRSDYACYVEWLQGQISCIPKCTLFNVRLVRGGR